MKKRARLLRPTGLRLPCPCYSKDMARVTSKLQVTIPKSIAVQYGIRPGQEVEWLPAGDAIRVVPDSAKGRRNDAEHRLALFAASVLRQREREHRLPAAETANGDSRGWTREDPTRGARFPLLPVLVRTMDQGSACARESSGISALGEV